MYSSSFGVTLIALTMITTLVILAVTSNVVLSLGMVGALSLLLTILFMNGEALGLEVLAREIGYESRLFDTQRVHTVDIAINDWDGFLQRSYGSDSGQLYKPDSMSFGGGRGNGRKFDIDDFMEQPDGQNRRWEMPKDGKQPPADGRQIPPERDGGSFSPPSMPDGGSFGGNGSSDVKLQYIDDDPDSYANIFNNAKTGASQADRQRLIVSIKSLNSYENLEDVLDTDEVLDDRPMQAWIFSDEAYTAMYYTLFTEFLDTVQIEEIINSTYALIVPYVEKDPTKFCTYEDFEGAVQTLKAFCALRAQSVRGQLSGAIPSTQAGKTRTLPRWSMLRNFSYPIWVL